MNAATGFMCICLENDGLGPESGPSSPILMDVIIWVDLWSCLKTG